MKNLSEITIPKFKKMSQVNLDALIPREDFRVLDADKNKSSTKIEKISIYNFQQDSFFFPFLRKPDFQRETNNWEPKKITQFIASFLDGNLIPALILWQGESKYIFVIDGAHRLSAIASWIYDDYGDGDLTKEFYTGEIPPEYKEVADETRKVINREIGKYSDYKLAIKHPEKVGEKIRERVGNLSTAAIQLQWVIGDATTAEKSFFKINEQAVPIDDTEKKILKARNKSNAIAARAISHAGTGHKYWSNFEETNIIEIEKLSKEINEVLFSPRYKTPITSMDLPLAGKAYSVNSLPLIFDLINIVNEDHLSLEDDITGNDTVWMLKRTKKILNRIIGKETYSLGLHPAIYFYSITGRYQVTAFYAILDLIKEYDKIGNQAFMDFTSVRGLFEDFIVGYKNLINQITSEVGSGLKSYKRMKKMFKVIIETLLKSKDKNNIDEEIFSAFKKHSDLEFLIPMKTELEITKRKDFSTGIKSATFLLEALRNAVKCKICNGYIHFKSTNVDHIQRKSEGGLGNIENAQITHPYCNTTYKN